jgi:hypothetical protein
MPIFREIASEVLDIIISVKKNIKMNTEKLWLKIGIEDS